jgi:hypothetical protein
VASVAAATAAATSVVSRESSPNSVRARQQSVRSDRRNVSDSLGVHQQQDRRCYGKDQLRDNPSMPEQSPRRAESSTIPVTSAAKQNGTITVHVTGCIAM